MKRPPKTASIESLARAVARGTLDEVALRRVLVAQHLSRIPTSLWQQIEEQRYRTPRFALTLARVAEAIAAHGRAPLSRARAQLALMKTLNVLCEFQAVRALADDAAARLKKLGQTESIADVWQQAAWANMWLRAQDAAEDALDRALAVPLAGQARRRRHNEVNWIRGRLARARGQYRQAARLYAISRAGFTRCGDITFRRHRLGYATTLCDFELAYAAHVQGPFMGHAGEPLTKD